MKALLIGLGITLLLLSHPGLAANTPHGRKPSDPPPLPGPVPQAPLIQFGAQLNGQAALPPNDSPLVAIARFTLHPFPFPPPPLPQPLPTPTNQLPILPIRPPIPITNVPPALISNPPPISLTNSLPALPPGAIIGSSGGAVLQTLAVTPTASSPQLPYPYQTTNAFEGFIVFPADILTNSLGLLPGAPSLEDEAGNPISNLVTFGSSPLETYINDGDQNAVFPFTGGFLLTPDQTADLLAGHWFLRVQALTASGQDYPPGAIRGRLLPVDSDDDGVPDYLDWCPGTEPGAAVDTNGCSVAQHCPCLWPWASHGDYVTCVQTNSSNFLQQGIITPGERAALLHEAAASDCGRRFTPAPPHSGISGESILMQGQDLPPVPYPTSITILSASGSLLTQTMTGRQGRFEVDLKPGVYIVVPFVHPPPQSNGPIALYPAAEPCTVTVPFKQFTNVVITYSYPLGPI